MAGKECPDTPVTMTAEALDQAGADAHSMIWNAMRIVETIADDLNGRRTSDLILVLLDQLTRAHEVIGSILDATIVPAEQVPA